MALITYSMTLKSTQMITPTVKYLSWVRSDGQDIAYVGGQFVTFHIPGPEKKIVHRSYSIANVPGQGCLDMACAYVKNGIASTLLFNMQPGETIQTSGPYGLFVLKNDLPKRYVLIGTGTGIAPYRAMLNDLSHRIARVPMLQVVILLGVRTREDALFLQDFLDFEQQHPRNVCFKVSYSQEPAGGRLQTLFPDLHLNPAEDWVYLCGNPMMIDESFALLQAMNFDKKQLHREKYGFSR
jgi:ferredoxin-NADP reductase